MTWPCNFAVEPADDGRFRATCRRCGRSVLAKSRTVIAVCRVQPPGLGDMVAAGLSAVGITKERVEAVVGPCGCDERQELLNRLGHEWLGLPPGNT